MTFLPIALLIALSAQPALAYVGPGSSLGALGMVFGLAGTLFLTLLSLIWYPLKRMSRKMRRARARRTASPRQERRA
ncbi:MAG: hypothetical protein QM690_10345 [Sphingobium sp.]